MLQIYYNDGDSSQWVTTNGADTIVQVSSSAPSSAQSGDLWWDSENGNLYVYYGDADSSQWVTTNNAIQGPAGPVAGSANQVVYKDSSNNPAGSSNLTFDGTNLVCGGTVTSNSDIRLKSNVKTITGALDKVSRLRGVEFDYKENGTHSIGFIAQEVEEVLPELVFGEDPKSVAYQNFVALLVESVKELREEVSSLREELNILKENN